MGGKKKAEKKKKGLGAEKTAQKTEKKLSAKMRKELALQGEEDIETLVARFSAEDAKKSCKTITEIPLTDRPSKRSNFSLVAHPNKDQLLMFGGECTVNKSTTVYSDFLCFDIKKQKWTQWECSGGPPPRAAHQAVTIAGDGGQMWMFGGEFVTPSESQFYHYRDLWVFHFKDRRWEKIEVKGGPSGRSGHRMVVLYTPNLPPRVAIFGGFHDSLRGDCRYYNDFYIFDLSERLWRKLEITGTPPAPRSGHLMAALNDGRIYIHGGFSKVKAPSKKKGFDDETGVVHADSFFLTPDKRDTTGTKFKWIQAKTTGSVPSKRCSSTLVAWTESGKNSALVFGGVHDDEEQEVLSDSSDEEEEVSTSTFFNDLYLVDLTKPSWSLVELSGPRALKEHKRRRKVKAAEGEAEDEATSEEEEDDEDGVEDATANGGGGDPAPVEEETKTVEDGIFTITVGPSLKSDPMKPRSDGPQGAAAAIPMCQPSPRMSSGMTIKNSVLYCFGGLHEKPSGGEVTYADFYSLDLKKLDEWKCLIPPEVVEDTMQVDSEESSDSDDDEESDDSDEEDADDDCGEEMQLG